MFRFLRGVALNSVLNTVTRYDGYRVNAPSARDKIKGAKGNFVESGRGRMMRYEIFVSRDGAIYPLAQRR